jgi:hypothetical protein
MKNSTWAVIVLVLAALCVIEFRYALVVNSPIVAKIDRITGNVWVANSGMWVKVKHPADEQCGMNCLMGAKRAEKSADKAATEKPAQGKSE